MAVPGVGPPRGTQAARRPTSLRGPATGGLPAFGGEGRHTLGGERKGGKNPEPLLLLTSHVLTLQILSTLCASLTSQAWMLRHQNPLFTGDEDAQWPSALRGPGVTGELQYTYASIPQASVWEFFILFKLKQTNPVHPFLPPTPPPLTTTNLFSVPLCLVFGFCF